MKTKKVMAGWYRTTYRGITYDIYKYEDGMWGLYTDSIDSATDGYCIWVDKRLKDCKQWLRRHTSTTSVSVQNILDGLEVWEYCVVTSEPIYQYIPDDPEYLINRAYRGKTVAEIAKEMSRAGWIVKEQVAS